MLPHNPSLFIMEPETGTSPIPPTVVSSACPFGEARESGSIWKGPDFPSRPHGGSRNRVWHHPHFSPSGHL